MSHNFDSFECWMILTDVDSDPCRFVQASPTTENSAPMLVSVQLRYRQDASFFNTLLAPVSNFFITATLQYAELTASDSFCLQGSSSSNSFSPCSPGIIGQCCRGSCMSDNVTCSGPCLPGPFCSSQSLCYGQNGVATCPNLQINRAGSYSLSFQYGVCTAPSFDLSGCEKATRAFRVSPLTDGVATLSLNCSQCRGPQTSYEGQPFSVVAEALDRLGNSILGGVVSVSICTTAFVASCQNPVPAQQFLDGLFSSEISSSVVSASLNGPLLVNISGGLALFTNLSVAIPYSRIQLVFSSAGKRIISRPFQILAKASVSIKLKQQPSAWTAGNSTTFQLYALNENGYVVERENSAVVSVSVLSGPNGGGLTCLGIASNCLAQTMQNGSATFELVFFKAGQYILRFSSDKYFCDSSPIVISNANPAAIYIIQQPAASVNSGSGFASPVTVALVDMFGNWIKSQISGSFDASCDEILQQLWCSRQVCASVPGFLAGQCCLKSLTKSMNNAYQCLTLPAGRYHQVSVDISCANNLNPCSQSPVLMGTVNRFGSDVFVFDDLTAFSTVDSSVELRFSTNLSGLILRNASNQFKILSISVWIFTVYAPPSNTSCVAAGSLVGGLASVLACKVCSDPSQCSSQTKPGSDICATDSRMNTPISAKFGRVNRGCITTNGVDCITGSSQGICGPLGLCDFTDLRVNIAGQFSLIFLATYISLSTFSTTPFCVIPSVPAGLQVNWQPKSSFIAGDILIPAPQVSATDAFGNILSTPPSCSSCYSLSMRRGF